jgi:hypothetical protein
MGCISLKCASQKYSFLVAVCLILYTNVDLLLVFLEVLWRNDYCPGLGTQSDRRDLGSLASRVKKCSLGLQHSPLILDLGSKITSTSEVWDRSAWEARHTINRESRPTQNQFNFFTKQCWGLCVKKNKQPPTVSAGICELMVCFTYSIISIWPFFKSTILSSVWA